MLLYPHVAKERMLGVTEADLKGRPWKHLQCFNALGLPFLCKKCQCLLLALEHLVVLGSDADDAI
jgi:hypothetical protein